MTIMLSQNFQNNTLYKKCNGKLAIDKVVPATMKWLVGPLWAMKGLKSYSGMMTEQGKKVGISIEIKWRQHLCCSSYRCFCLEGAAYGLHFLLLEKLRPQSFFFFWNQCKCEESWWEILNQMVRNLVCWVNIFVSLIVLKSLPHQPWPSLSQTHQVLQ